MHNEYFDRKMRRMKNKGIYFGSVRFFKHLFLGIIALMIAVPTSMAVYFWALLHGSQDNIELVSLQEPGNANFSYAYTGSVLEGDDTDSANSSAVPRGDDMAEYPPYEDLFPELFISSPAVDRVSTPKTAFLTFDDGPSERTAEILDILKANDIKATFFVVGDNLKTEANRDILKRMAAEGHSIGIHTMSHDYSTIYDSVEHFLTDFNEAYQLIYQITGIQPDIFRFPGGSINGYNIDNYQEIISEMIRRGFTYYDWNIAAGDATGALSVNKICDNVIKPALKKSRAIILMHDSADKHNTVKSLETIIDALREGGFAFMPISREVKPIIFRYKY